MHKLLLSLLAVTSLIVLACGNEGVMEGVLNNAPFKVEVENVLAVQGASYYNSPSYWMYPQVAAPNPLTIYMGNDYSSATITGPLLIITISDITQVYPGYVLPLPSYNIDAELMYPIDSEIITDDAIEGSSITFNNVGYYLNEEVSGYFEIFLNAGYLAGSFSTDVGISAR